MTHALVLGRRALREGVRTPEAIIPTLFIPLFLVEEIEGGYFDKLRATPVHRSAIVVGRLIAEGVKGLLIASLLVLLGLAFGITIASGVVGFVLLILLTAGWAVVYSGFM